MLESQPFIDRLFSQGKLSKLDWEDLITILFKSEPNLHNINAIAKKIQHERYGNRVFLRALIEISNYCPNHCHYCGISCWNKELDRYRLDTNAIIETVELGTELGYRSFVLQGGEDPYYTDEILINIIRQIKNRHPEIALTLSLGERSDSSYQSLFGAGADRYLLRHETANQELYGRLHPNMSFENRIRSLLSLKRIGFQTGSGFLIGLPGQNIKSYAEDFVLLQEIQPEMIGIGPFIPHHKTPLALEPAGNVREVKILLSLLRIAFPNALIPATTALGTLDPTSRFEALSLGANVLMPNITPIEKRSQYTLYDGKRIINDESAQELKQIQMRCAEFGMLVELSRGDHNQYIPSCK